MQNQVVCQMLMFLIICQEVLILISSNIPPDSAQNLVTKYYEYSSSLTHTTTWFLWFLVFRGPKMIQGFHEMVGYPLLKGKYTVWNMAILLENILLYWYCAESGGIFQLIKIRTSWQIIRNINIWQTTWFCTPPSKYTKVTWPLFSRA